MNTATEIQTALTPPAERTPAVRPVSGELLACLVTVLIMWLSLLRALVKIRGDKTKPRSVMRAAATSTLIIGALCALAACAAEVVVDNRDKAGKFITPACPTCDAAPALFTTRYECPNHHRYFGPTYAPRVKTETPQLTEPGVALPLPR